MALQHSRRGTNANSKPPMEVDSPSKTAEATVAATDAAAPSTTAENSNSAEAVANKTQNTGKRHAHSRNEEDKRARDERSAAVAALGAAEGAQKKSEGYSKKTVAVHTGYVGTGYKGESHGTWRMALSTLHGTCMHMHHAHPMEHACPITPCVHRTCMHGAAGMHLAAWVMYLLCCPCSHAPCQAA